MNVSKGFTLVEVLIAMAVAMVMAFTAASAMLTLLRTERLTDSLAQAEWAVRACLCQKVTDVPVTETIALGSDAWVLSSPGAQAEEELWQAVRMSKPGSITLDMFFFSGPLTAARAVSE